VERGLLARFFDRVTRQAFGDLALDDPPAARYLADLLTRFARTEALYPVQTSAKRRLETVGDSLLEIQRIWDWESPEFNPDAELKKVYAEAESLRMEAALAKQRINQLEAQLRALSGARSKNGVLSSGQQLGGQPRPSGTKTNGGRSQSPLARRQRPVPHLQQPVVLLAGSDGDAQVTGEAHVGAVAHQDPRLEQRRPQPARLRVHLDEEEISLRRR